MDLIPEPQSEGIVIPLLGRALTSEEAALAASKPISSLPLSRTLLTALAEGGCKTVADLIKMCWSGGSFGPIRSRKIRNSILAVLESKAAANGLGDVCPAALAGRIEEALARLREPRRTIIRLKYGLWDGHCRDIDAIAQAVSLDDGQVRMELFEAHAELRALFRAKSDGFRDMLRSLYRQLLAARQGMAVIREWEDPTSLLYKGQEKECQGFAFLCRLGKVVPDRLVTMGLNGICYDGLQTQSRHDKVVDAMKTALVNAERPVSVTQMLGWLSRIERSQDFLRRCVEVSREMGFMKSGMIGLKANPYFDAHSLRAMARAALVSFGKPAHFHRIAREIERLYPDRAPIKIESVYHELAANKDDFALAKHGGVYGLAEWPARAVDNLKDFLSDFLREKGGNASRQELMAAAKEKGYKTASVSTILYSNPELFRHVSWGQWGLAA